MALSTLVKINGVNNLSDARFCAGMGASILGFCPEENHPDFVDPKKFSDITGWVAGVKIAGEFYHTGAARIREIMENYRFDYLQVEDPGLVKELSDTGKPLLFRIDLSDTKTRHHIDSVLHSLKEHVAFYIVEGHDTGEEWILRSHRWSEKFPILFGAGVTKENVLSVLNRHHYKGLSLRGGTEIKPGYYDFGELADILELLDPGDQSQ